MEDKSVKHAGIKGMKWGVRRYQNKDGSLTPAGRKRYGDGPSQQERMKGMSDQELRQRINRIQMEKQYLELTKKKKSAGAKFIEDVLLNSGKQLATNYTTKFAQSQIDKIIANLGEQAKTKTGKA